LKVKTIILLLLVIAASAGSLSQGTAFAATSPQNYQAMTGGLVQVAFNSVQLTIPPPEAYSFGIDAKTVPGLWIAKLVWQFGDGSVLTVAYCCENEVSEVRYHTYAQPQSYTVTVVAYDSAGNYGSAVVTVNWALPAPEFPTSNFTMMVSFIALLATAGLLRTHQSSKLTPH